MRKSVLLASVAAAVVAVVAPVVPSAAGAATPAPVIQHWYAGVEAGTTTLGTAAGATCKPLLGTKATDSRCLVTFSGRWVATDQPYHGTYSGTAYVNYLDPKNSSYAAWDQGVITYVVRDASGKLLKTVTGGIDSGTGGIQGYPYDLSLTYAIEVRNEQENFLERMSGTGLNKLDANLKPIRTFIDRIGFQNGI